MFSFLASLPIDVQLGGNSWSWYPGELSFFTVFLKH